jgi:hypothetical protein
MKSSPISTTHLVAALIGLLVAGLVWRWQRDPVGHGPPRIVITAVVPASDTYQIFLDDGQGYSPDRVLDLPVHGSADEQQLTFNLPAGTRYFHAFRFDPGDRSALLRISRMELVGPYDRWTWEGQGLIDLFANRNRAELHAMLDGRMELTCSGPDPWIGTGKDMLPVSAEVLSGRPPLIRAFATALISLVIVFLLVLFLHRILRRLSPPRITALQRPARALVVLLCIDVFVMLAVLGVVQRIRERPSGLQLRMQVITGEPDVFQLFYSDRPGEFDQGRSVFAHTLRSAGPQWVTFKLPPDSLPKFLRFDPGSLQDSLIIQQAELVLNDGRVPVELKALHMAIGQRHQVGPVQLREADIRMTIDGDDPFLYLGLDTRTLTDGLRYRSLPVTWALLSALLAVSLVHAGLWRSARFQVFVQQASTRDTLFAVAFLILLTIPLTVTFNPALEPPQNFSEKRTLATLPELDLRGLGGYAAQYDTWYRDHFGFRGELFRWNSMFHVALLHTSPLPDKLMLGTDRWLYQYHPLLDGYYRGLPAFDPGEMERVRRLCEQRQQWLAARGIRYYILIPPMGATVYPEHLPTRFQRLSDTTWLGQVKAYFDRHSTVPIIDPTAQLLEAKQHRDVYFTSDIHWNPYGSYFGYKALIDRIRQDDPRVPAAWPIGDLQFTNDTNTAADMANMLGLNDVLPRIEPMVKPLHPRRAAFRDFPELQGSSHFLDRAMHYTNPDTTLPRLLMFHDSFGLYLKPLLNEHFSSATYVWYPLYLPDVVTQVKPDIVVQEFMEMFVINMPKDSVPPTR